MLLTAYIGVISGSKSTLWVLMSSVLQKTAQRRVWWKRPKNISQSLLTKHELYKLLLNDESLSNRPVVEKAYKEHKATVQQELGEMKIEWWSNISEDVLSGHDRKYSKTMYSLLRKAFWSTLIHCSTFEIQGWHFSVKEPSRYNSTLARTLFKSIFFNPSEVNLSVIDSLHQHDIIHLMDLTPTIEELRIAPEQINFGKVWHSGGTPTTWRWKHTVFYP